jgi:hypothetical protein
MGFFPLPDRVFWNGKKHTVYVRDIDAMLSLNPVDRRKRACERLDRTTQKGFIE